MRHKTQNFAPFGLKCLYNVRKMNKDCLPYVFWVMFFVLWCFQSLETDTPDENDDELASHADVGTGTL